ncbi:Putative mitochondrial carrier protein PET8 [Seminavis robusta]|uniref:Mitochondrial carrier protein PET8 n=1 Tax=Seminavis robusta TaxID=568900 RepID=A0A9N8HBS6_9STRA|nr:Putative mitochondrial carrier protein PET8 [Seminavis robusta]|eukprot:Sro351_g123810.1 Putative mitochondrial carrier protein PET8 (1334) ;mRNA; r:2271-6756
MRKLGWTLLVLLGSHVLLLKAFQTPFIRDTGRYIARGDSFPVVANNNKRRRGGRNPVRLFTFVEKDSNDQKQQKKKEEEKLSEMDARVLQSLLQDSEKLNLKTEESMKKLLERGVVSKDVPQAPKKETDDDSEFSSEVLKTFSDTKLWQAVSRKAEDWLESAKLFVVNRIERDAMTLAALGLFAWERVVRDVGRALPAAGNSTAAGREDKKSFLLSEKSSVDEMTTPMDELKSVGTAVAEILKSGGTDGTTSASTLRTAATSRQDKRNFQRTYQRAQEKADAQKNPAKVTQQAASSVVDTAWQLKRELEVESNAPGYKTKKVQTALEAAKDSTKQLLQGAQETWRLERAKVREQRELAAAANATTVSPEPVKEDTNEEDSSSSNTIMDVNAIDVQAIEKEEVIFQEEEQQQVQDDPVYAKRLEEARKRAEWQAAERQELQRLHKQQEKMERRQQLLAIQSELQTECFCLKDQIQNCIVNPEQTWLKADVIEGLRDFDQAMIKQVVSELIATRNQVKELIKGQGFSSTSRGKDEEEGNEATIQAILSQFVLIRENVEDIKDHAKRAVSLGASQALEQNLFEEGRDNTGDNLIPVMLRLDEIQHDLQRIISDLAKAEQPQDSNNEEKDDERSFDVSFQDVVEPAETVQSESTTEASPAATPVTIEPEIVDVMPEAFVYAFATATDIPGGTQSEQGKDASYGAVEVVTDDDFDAAVGETRQVVATDLDEDEMNAVAAAQEKENNIIVNLLLRALDIVFFLLEKLFTVAIPTALGSSTVAKERLDNVAQGGLGSEGWKRIGQQCYRMQVRSRPTTQGSITTKDLKTPFENFSIALRPAPFVLLFGIFGACLPGLPVDRLHSTLLAYSKIEKDVIASIIKQRTLWLSSRSTLLPSQILSPNLPYSCGSAVLSIYPYQLASRPATTSTQLAHSRKTSISCSGSRMIFLWGYASCLILAIGHARIGVQAIAVSNASPLTTLHGKSKRRSPIPDHFKSLRPSSAKDRFIREDDDTGRDQVATTDCGDDDLEPFLVRGGGSTKQPDSAAWVDGLKNSMASALAAAFSKIILAPFDTIKTLQQYHQTSPDVASLTLTQAARQIMQRPGGFSNFYAGLGVSVVGAMPSVALYFGTYSYFKKALSAPRTRADGTTYTLHKTLAVGLAAAMGNTLASFSRVPYEVLKQKLQTNTYRNTWEAVRAVTSWEMIFPKGSILIQMARDIPYAVVTLLIYEHLQSWQASQQQQLAASAQASSDMVLGAISGGIGSWVTNPLDVIKTRLQTAPPEMYGGSISKCFVDTWKEGGGMAFLRGSWPRLMHKIPANGFFFLFYEFFRRLFRCQGYS